MKNLFFDLLNGFTVYDFILLFLQLFAALFIGQWLRIMLRNTEQNTLKPAYFAIVPVIMALLVILSHNSAPMSISALGVFILAGPTLKDSTQSDKLTLFLLAGAGFGCGSGYVLVTILVYLLIISPIVYLTIKRN